MMENVSKVQDRPDKDNGYDMAQPISSEGDSPEGNAFSSVISERNLSQAENVASSDAGNVRCNVSADSTEMVVDNGCSTTDMETDQEKDDICEEHGQGLQQVSASVDAGSSLKMDHKSNDSDQERTTVSVNCQSVSDDATPGLQPDSIDTPMETQVPHSKVEEDPRVEPTNPPKGEGRGAVSAQEGDGAPSMPTDSSSSGDACAKGEEDADALFDNPMEASSTTTEAPAAADNVAEESSTQGAMGTTDTAGSAAAAAAAVVSDQLPNSDSLGSVYYLKWFSWEGVQTPLVTQNENGPCPLLAIANVLMLSRKIQIPSMQEFITAQQLMEYIGDYLLSLAPKENNDEGFLLNYEQNVQDAIAIMHKLQTGIDVNVKFTGCRDFEFTRECVVFDLLHIGLYHGWLVDPQDDVTRKAIGSCSYNQIVEKIIASKEVNSSPDDAAEGFAAEGFLEQTASQLTYHGLYELTMCIAPGELCVFFRNNHFSTLYKHKDKLFLLVTDQGYLTEPKIIWETLSNVEGDGDFVSADFQAVGPIQNYGGNPGSLSSTGMTQEDRDYLVALSLQEKAPDGQEVAPNWELTPEEAMRQELADQERKDLLLALRLQEQERQLVTQQQRQQRRVDSRMAPQGRAYPHDTDNVHRPRVSNPSQGVSQEDRQQQGKCSIL